MKMRKISMLSFVMASLIFGCQTPQQKEEQAALQRQMAWVKKRIEQKEAADQELARKRIAEYEARKKTDGAQPAPAVSGSPPAPAAQQINVETPEPPVEAEKKPAVQISPHSTKAGTPKGWQKDLIRDLKNYPEHLKEDTMALIAKENLLENSLAFGTGLSLAIVSKSTSWDREVKHAFAGHDRFGAATDIATVLGHPGVHFGFAALTYTYGVAYKSEMAAQAGRRLFEALAINDLLTLGLQLATNQRRPNGERMAFPSGHTSSSFALATVLHGVYGPVVGIPMYGLAGFIGAARLDANEHHLSDVLLGAALGYIVGRTVTKTDRKRTVLGFEVDPWVDEETGAGGLQLRRRF